MKTLESILDTDLDVTIISFPEFIDAVTKKMTTKQIKEFKDAISISFEPADDNLGAHNYFGTIEACDEQIVIHYDPYKTTQGRGNNVVGALRRVIEIDLKTGKRKTSTTGCHWLVEPCYQIPWTKENLYKLDELYH